MSKQIEALKLALECVEAWDRGCDRDAYWRDIEDAVTAIREALTEQPAQQQEPVTVLPDGSAFAVMSYPLPKDHWLYADRQYNDGEYEPVELGKPVLTHELRDAVVSAVRYAIRGATNCGKEVDFDPDALVQNAVYALCGPFTSPPASKPLTDEQKDAARYRFLAEECRSTSEHWGGRWSIVIEGPAPKTHDSEDDFDEAIDRAIEAAHGIKGDA